MMNSFKGDFFVSVLEEKGKKIQGQSVRHSCAWLLKPVRLMLVWLTTSKLGI